MPVQTDLLLTFFLNDPVYFSVIWMINTEYRNPNDNTEVIELSNKCMQGVEDEHRIIFPFESSVNCSVRGQKGLGKGEPI